MKEYEEESRINYITVIIACIFMWLLLFFTLLKYADSALIDRGSGLIYCDTLDITLLQDASYAQTIGYDSDNKMTQTEALDWTSNLEYYDSMRAVVYDDWRLFSAGNNPQVGYNQTSSETGHLYYTELGNTGPEPVTKSGPFLNLTQTTYRTETLCSFDPDDFWAFSFYGGRQSPTSSTDHQSVWPVRDGDVVAPLPSSIMLLLFSFIGLIGIRKIVKEEREEPKIF